MSRLNVVPVRSEDYFPEWKPVGTVQVCFSWAMVREAEHPSSTHTVRKKEFWILINKCGNNLKHENETEGHGL